MEPRQLRLVIFLSVCLSAAWIASGASGPRPKGVAASPQITSANTSVQDLIRQSGAQVAVAYRSLDGAHELFIDADRQFPATNQWVEIPVMIELRGEVQGRTLQLSDRIVVHNSFRSVADESVYHLDRGLDRDPELYGEIGRRASLGNLEEQMMRRNSELATNLLIETLGISRIDGRLADMNASGIEIRHGFQDFRAEAAGIRNTASARGIMEVLWMLANGRAVSAQASEEMAGVLANSRTATSGPFASTQTSGSVGGNQQEALIIHGAHSCALAVVVHGKKSGAASAVLISKIAHELAAPP